MKQILGLIALLSVQNIYAEVYTCHIKGQTVYQGKPCPGTATGKLNIPPTSLTDTQKDKLWKVSRSPKIGMSGNQVIKSTNWGEPDRKRSYITARGSDELWYYSKFGYLTFKNGKVISISEDSGSDR